MDPEIRKPSALPLSFWATLNGTSGQECGGRKDEIRKIAPRSGQLVFSYFRKQSGERVSGDLRASEVAAGQRDPQMIRAV